MKRQLHGNSTNEGYENLANEKRDYNAEYFSLVAKIDT